MLYASVVRVLPTRAPMHLLTPRTCPPASHPEKHSCRPARLQFCMLEPELLCRLVFVKDVECQLATTAATAAATEGAGAAAAAAAAGGAVGQQQQLQGGGGSGGFRAPPGTTELPTCPVCLERLDEHISGIVTTVSGQ
jgi:hypothetical protein